MKHLISCSCGELQGEIRGPKAGVRAICYCKDCQIFAAYLDKANDVLDESGGTEVIGLRHSNILFTHGIDNLKCVSLSKNGLLRWYAGCCKTPIGNTPRNFKVSHIGLIHNCIVQQPSSSEKVFGPVQLRVNTDSAKKPVKELKPTISVISHYVFSILKERLSGRYKLSPFFKESGEPLLQVSVLTEHQHHQLVDTI